MYLSAPMDKHTDLYAPQLRVGLPLTQRAVMDFLSSFVTSEIINYYIIQL